MSSNSWQLQRAKDHFSEVVERARSSGAQIITKHGRPVVVVVEVNEFKNLQPAPKAKKKPSLLEILRKCPAPEVFANIDESRRLPDYGRNIDLG